MKPLHGEFKKLSRCRCCVSRYSKHNKGSKAGKSAARRRNKNNIKRELNNE